ncbi:MAG: hypothetical protein LBV33_05595, partial [Lachnospiraceae bacterium]|nr:hypothetical protein [Lachnospiraceae bacterium]
MGRIIKPLEIATQTKDVILALENDAEMLRDTLAETQVYAQTKALQGKTWTVIKTQLTAHGTVIHGLLCMIDAMVTASEQLSTLSGDEELDEDRLLDQIDQLKETKAAHEEAIDSYEDWLRT